jgi:hypothetical protein
MRALLLALACTALAACGREEAPPAAPATAADPATPWVRSDWPLPVTDGAMAPDLRLAPNGRLLLSWISRQPGRRDAVQFAAYLDDRWDNLPKTVAVGTALVANWADTPHIAATADGALWMHWLQKSGDAAHAYDVWLTTSRNAGVNWDPPVRVHDDGTATEHGFVSLWPADRNTLGIAWLDGRNTGGGHGHGGEGPDQADQAEHGGAMTLRAARFDYQLQRRDEAELDAMTCDCCQTDVAMTARGPLLVYRGRDANEIRDILATRGDGKAWTPARKVHDDQWRMPACPVNGPAVAAAGNAALVAWYTEAGGAPRVRAAVSNDAGDRFAAPVEVAGGAAQLGRVDVAFDGRQAFVAWLEEDAGGQRLQLARYSADLSKKLQQLEVAKLQGRGRGTGFPKLALRDGIAYLAWTDLVDGRTRLQGARFAPRTGQ